MRSRLRMSWYPLPEVGSQCWMPIFLLLPEVVISSRQARTLPESSRPLLLASMNWTVNEARLFTDGTIDDGMADFTITENFIDLFKDESQFSGATDKGVTVVVEMIGIPDGLTFNCKVTATTNLTGAEFADVAEVTFDVDNDTEILELTGTATTTAISDITVSCGDAADGMNNGDGIVVDDDELPFAPATISVRVSLSPDGDALDEDGDVIESDTADGTIPRYVETFTDAIDLIDIVPATTTLLMPFVSTEGPASIMGISNTTADPFGDDGAGGADGTLTFWLFPSGGDMVMWSTDADPTVGSGLDDDGVLVSGNTYLVSIADILTAAESDDAASFTGYVFVETNFTHAHGVGYITNLAGITAAADVLVVPNPGTGGRDAGSGESLDN